MVMKARVCISSWLLLGGCTIEQGGTDDFAVMTTGGASSTSTTASETAAASTSSSTAADTTGAADSTSSADAESSSSSSTGSAVPECGNGVPDGDEECDDGNDDEFDDCTSQCTIPVCDDGMHNGDETDVDCGGTCQGCALCELCEEASDCDGAMVCDDGGQCIVHHDIEVDWVSNCPGQAQGVTIESLPLGMYRATATQSAGTNWLPPHNPPTTGYYYEARCTGATFNEMHTPEDVRYISVAAAFDAMVSETETFQYLGGDFTCWHADNGCDDNNGGVEFSIDYICER